MKPPKPALADSTTEAMIERSREERLALEYIAEAWNTGFTEVFLRVRPDNAAALRCYRRAGFTPVDADRTAEWNAVQPIDYVWLESSTGR